MCVCVCVCIVRQKDRKNEVERKKKELLHFSFYSLGIFTFLDISPHSRQDDSKIFRFYFPDKIFFFFLRRVEKSNKIAENGRR